MSETIPARFFEFHKGSSDKFWEITLDGLSHTVRYGRAGTDGQTKTKHFADVEKARTSYEKLIKQKVGKGYTEVEKSDARTEKIKASRAQAAEHQPFIEAILDSPDDPAPYGVYADWLEENGDVRGEFINTQLRLEDESLNTAERKLLKKAEQELLTTNVRDWIGEELAPYLIDNIEKKRFSWLRGPLQSFEFEKGFLSEISVQLLTFPFAMALRQSPHLSMLRKLKFDEVCSVDQLFDEFPEFEDRDWDEDGENPCFAALRQANLTNLRTFHCETEGYGNGNEIEKLIKKMPALEHLHLENRHVDLAAIFKLKFPNLRVMHIHNQFEHPFDVLAANKSLKNVEELNFHPHAFDSSDEPFIGVPAIEALCKSENLPKLSRVALWCTDFGDEGLKLIIETGLLARLKVLDIPSGAVTDEGARMLLGTDLSKLNMLNLTGNYLTSETIKPLQQMAKKEDFKLFARDMHSGTPEENQEHLYDGDWE